MVFITQNDSTSWFKPHLVLTLTSNFMQGTASLVATTSAVNPQTISLQDESLDTSTMSCNETLLDSSLSDQLSLPSTPSHSSVETVDHDTYDMQISSPSSPSISDISSISPLSLPSTPDEGVHQHANSDHVLAETSGSHSNSVFFKIVGDNLDKDVKPRDMRSDHQTESFHFFNSLAVKDRISLAHHSSITIVVDPDTVNLNQYLPSSEDYHIMTSNMVTLVSRVLVKHIPSLLSYTPVVESHIKHPYSKEMAQKSTVVSIIAYITFSSNKEVYSISL